MYTGRAPAPTLTAITANHTIKLVLYDLEFLRESDRSQKDDRESRDSSVAPGAEKRAHEVSRFVVVELVLGLILDDVGGETGLEVDRALLPEFRSQCNPEQSVETTHHTSSDGFELLLEKSQLLPMPGSVLAEITRHVSQPRVRVDGEVAGLGGGVEAIETRDDLADLLRLIGAALSLTVGKGHDDCGGVAVIKQGRFSTSVESRRSSKRMEHTSECAA